MCVFQNSPKVAKSLDYIVSKFVAKNLKIWSNSREERGPGEGQRKQISANFSTLKSQLTLRRCGRWSELKTIGAVVVAKMLESSHPIPEVRSSNPVIGQNLY